MFIRFFSAIVISIFCSVHAFAGDPYTVANVHVDAVAANALEAQTLAISQGQVRAANILIKRMSLETEREAKGFSGVSAKDGSKMIRALEIANEKRSANRYIGDITIAFNQNAISQYMRAKNLTLISSQARKRLVLPLLDGVGMWEPNGWAQAWQSANISNSLTPMFTITPKPELSQLITDPYMPNLSMETLRAMGKLYGVQQILILNKGSLGVRMVDVALDTGTRRDFGRVQGLIETDESGRILSNGENSTIAAVVKKLEEDWKASTVSSVSSKSVLLPISVLYGSQSEWQELQDVINGSSQIRSARLDAVSKRGALMELTFGGNMERLRNELAFKGVSLKTNEDMGLIMYKTGSF